MIWELIQANKRKSIMLMAVMAFVLLAMGGLIGMLVNAKNPQNGAMFGMIIASAVFAILTMISFSAGDQILLSSSKAVPITKEMHPQLFNVVEEMTIAAQLPNMPKIYIIPDPSPNAFATGRNPKNASIAVTAGLLSRLNRDELQGVIAHEMSHIIHRDILYVTLAGIMLGSIVLISQVFLRSMFYSSMGRRTSSRDNQGGGAILVLVIAIIAAILAPILAQVLYYSLSRRREYLADAGAARLTRYPEGLACALEKISGAHVPMETANKVTAPMYIIPPMVKDRMAFAGLGMTHPPIAKRVAVLRKMTHGAAFSDYSEAFTSVTGSKHGIPKSALADKEQVQIRDSSGKSSPSSTNQNQQMRQANDIIRMVNGFAFLNCACGLKMKLPPNFKAKQIACPKCGTVHNVN
jgi:heat shock protein HtpX